MEPRIRVDARIEGTKRRVDGGSEEHKGIGAFVTEGPVLVEDLRAGGSRVWHTELVWMVL